MKTIYKTILGVLLVGAIQTAFAGTHVRMDATHPHDKYHRAIGSIYAQDTIYGVIFKPRLRGLKPGLHAFHIHEKAKCGDFAKDAGGHYDPDETKRHRGPYDDDGHLGDLPPLFVAKDGTATLPVLAPRISLWRLRGRSLVIHAGPDNYHDRPKKNGGGGDRVACGVIR